MTRVIVEIKVEIKKYPKTSENTDTTFQNLWERIKTRDKYTAIQAHIKKQEIAQINNLISHLKELKKEQSQNQMPIEERK